MGDARSAEDVYGAALPSTPEEVLRAIWDKPSHVKEYERGLFAKLRSALRPGETAGLNPATAPLAGCLAWTQTKGSVLLVVWLQGALNETEVEITTEPTDSIIIQTRGFAAVVDREFAYAIDSARDVDSVPWAEVDMVAFKITKRDYGRRWEALFAGDSRLLRAVDFGRGDAYAAAATTDFREDLCVAVTVPVPAWATRDDVRCDVRTSSVAVSVKGWQAPAAGAPLGDWFKRHLKYKTKAADSFWEFHVGEPADDGPRKNGCASCAPRNVVSVTLFLTSAAQKRVVCRYAPDGSLVEDDAPLLDGDLAQGSFLADVPDADETARSLFLEDEDGMLTGAVAEIVAHLDGQGHGRLFCALCGVAQHLLGAIPPAERGHYLFEETDEVSDPESIPDWWRRQSREDELECCERLGRKDGGAPSTSAGATLDSAEYLDDDDDESILVEEVLVEEVLPLPPGGMLGRAPVRIAELKSSCAAAAPKSFPVSATLSKDFGFYASSCRIEQPALLRIAPTLVSDYAFEAAGSTVKVYVPFAIDALGACISKTTIASSRPTASHRRRAGGIPLWRRHPAEGVPTASPRRAHADARMLLARARAPHRCLEVVVPRQGAPQTSAALCPTRNRPSERFYDAPRTREYDHVTPDAGRAPAPKGRHG